MKKVVVAVLAVGVLALAGCSSDSQVVNDNITKDADNFKILRRIVFYNGITDSYVLSVEGYCSVEPGGTIWVTCKIGETYKRHMLGRSDNVTWFAEQLEAVNVSSSHYKVIFKPSVIIPDVEVR